MRSPRLLLALVVLAAACLGPQAVADATSRTPDRAGPVLVDARLDERGRVVVRWSERVVGGHRSARTRFVLSDGRRSLTAVSVRTAGSVTTIVPPALPGGAPVVVRYRTGSAGLLRDRAGNRARATTLRIRGGSAAPQRGPQARPTQPDAAPRAQAPAAQAPAAQAPAAQAPAVPVVPAPAARPDVPAPPPATQPAPAGGTDRQDEEPGDLSIAPVQARMADGFAASVGVNVHTNYWDTPYVSLARVTGALRTIGVRGIRDGLVRDSDEQWRRFREYARLGFDVNLIMGDPAGRYGGGPIENLVWVLKNRLAGAVTSVEGANEYDISGDANWRTGLRTHQCRLYELINQDPALAHLPVLGPSIVRDGNRRALGDLSGCMDRGNMHPYPGGRPASLGLPTEIESNRAVAGPTHPLVATETGYHNAIRTTDGHLPASEAATAAYLPRLLLEYYRAGVTRTYLYELIDLFANDTRTHADSNFGLLRHDGSLKPSAHALRRLTSVVTDRGADFAPGELRVALSGETDGVRTMVLQKRDGTFVVAVWHDLPVWDHQRRVDLPAPVRRVRLNLGRPAEQVRVRSTSQDDPVATASRTRAVDLEVGGHPLLVELQHADR